MAKATAVLALLFLAAAAGAAQDVHLGFDKLSDDPTNPFSQPYTLESVLVVQEIPDKDFGGNQFVLPQKFDASITKLKGQARDILPTAAKLRVEPIRIAQAEYSSRDVTMLVTVEQNRKKTTWKATQTKSGNRVTFQFPADFKSGGGFFGMLKLPTQALGYRQTGGETAYAGWAYLGVEPEITFSVKPVLYDAQAYASLGGNADIFNEASVRRDTRPPEAQFESDTEKNVIYRTTKGPATQAVQGTAAAYAPQWTGRADSNDLEYVPNGEYMLVLDAKWKENGKEETFTVEKGPVKVVSFQNVDQPAQYKLQFKPGNRFVFGDYAYKILDLSGSSAVVQAIDQQFGTEHLAKTNERQ
ncbi:MAG: hypothetical protein Q8P02_02265, partial [Candidatus Micrarchaeota archaeon]|nr:hypothetical protein [Candidatus Micrarchaeota archaeon]